MNTLSLSVIIPAYNEEKYLPTCLKSLQYQQRIKADEIIVVDNNSNDNTASIAPQYGARLIYEPIRGVARTKNTGARNAKGDILVFLDADTIPPPDHLAKIIGHVTNSSGCAHAGPYIHHDGGPLLYWCTQKGRYYSSYFRFIRAISGVQGFSGGNFIIAKSLFHKINGFNETISDINIPEDWEFAIRLSRANISIVYDPALWVFSSARRIKRSPFDSIMRGIYVLVFIHQNNLTRKRLATKPLL